MNAGELRARGNAALGEGRLEEALDYYRQAAAADPKDPIPWLNMGFVNVETGRWPDAEKGLTHALSLARPGDDFLPDVYFLRGRARQQMGASLQALADYQAAAAARAGFVEATILAAQLLLELKRYDEAIDWSARAAALTPDPQPRLIAAQAMERLERPADALGILDAVLAQDPGNVTALEGRGTMLLRLDRLAEAFKAFEQIIARGGETVTRLSNAAIALHRMGNAKDAAAYARRAIALGTQSAADAHNLGAVLQEMLRLDEAMDLLEGAAKRFPRDVDIGWDLSNGYLLRGDLPKGFALYENRFLREARDWKAPPDFGLPRWTHRESLAGRSILVIGEYGLGDAIHMLRYIPLLTAQASAVVLRLHHTLEPLARSFARNCHWDPGPQPPARTDFQCPLMSLPLAFGTTLETIPANVPYFRADPVRVEAWKKRLDALGPARRVGIVWSGNPRHPNDHNRSIPLEMFRRIAVPGIQFVSLQPEIRASDRQAYESWRDLARFGEELKDFGDTAALATALDLVVMVDSSVAHLAGSLGCPVWVLLPHYPDWRWLLGRDDSPWYPTMRLWRQPVPRDWPAVLDGVRGELERVKGIEPSS